MIQYSKTQQQILKDITEELISDEKGKDKSVKRKIITDEIPIQ